MAEFVQTMKDWKRMCNVMAQEDEYTACDKCDLKSFGCPAIYEKECADADWEHVEKVVVAWAAEHPEPQYPTWWKYLCMIDVIPDTLGDKTLGEVTIERLMSLNIPADTAQKLGIEPKEVTC